MTKEKDTQPLRRSQYIYTYGPGSIIETKNGPRLIPSLKNGLQAIWNNNELFEKYEIADVRLCQYLAKSSEVPNQCKIITLPSNARTGSSRRGLYITQRFPEWEICYNTDNHNVPILHKGSECPICNSSNKNAAVRFVAACPNGHLDDIDWNYAVHKGEHCSTNYYEWIAEGTSLKDIKIRCPKCKKETTMEDVYKLKLKCTGRKPEKELKLTNIIPYYSQVERPKDCEQKMTVVQRQSASLRIPDIITLLTIPEYDDEVSLILQQSTFKQKMEGILEQPSRLPKSNEEWIDLIKNFSKVSNESKEIIINFINNNGYQTFIDKYNGMESKSTSFIEMMNEELSALVHWRGKKGTIHFEIGNPEIIDINQFSSDQSLIPKIEISPIYKIRTVTVQRGYRRPVINTEEKSPELIPVAERSGDTYWFPGFEGFGEGIFLYLNSESLSKIPHKDAYKSWIDFKAEKSIFNSDWYEIATKPEFVWLHTLSHAIIKALTEFTGYSAPSIHERIYYNEKEGDGGILIYNTTPGDDGGMGGLTDTVCMFDKVLEHAENNIILCSNDPLCSDIKRTDNHVNGAACYGCLLISETSCEHGNRWLDRHLFLDGDSDE